MRDLELDDWVGKVKAPMGPRKLELFNTQGREVPQTNDGLCSRNESLREIADDGSKNGARPNAHVEVKADG